MRYVVLLLALFTVGCGDDPLAPSAPVIPPPTTSAVTLCEVVIPAVPVQLLCTREGCIFVGAPERILLKPCD